MILYDKYLEKLNIYETIVDKEKLIKYKKKHLEDIKTVLLHVEEEEARKLLFSSSTIRYNVLDRTTKNGTNYIEVKNDKSVIDSYINGEFDSTKPIYIIRDTYLDKEPDLNDDYTLLFPGGSKCRKEFKSDDSILLSGTLADIQPLLCDNLLGLEYLSEDTYDFEFNDVIKYKKIKSLKYSDIEYAIENGIVRRNTSFEEELEKSALVLKLISK